MTEQEEELEESKKREFIKKRVDPYYSEISLLHTSFKVMMARNYYQSLGFLSEGGGICPSPWTHP